MSGWGRAAAVGGLLLTLLLAALDATAVATAMPRILAELGGLDRYTWVTTAYLLTSTVTMPVAGKLSDLYGRKLVLLTGVGWFVAASLLCAAAGDLIQLIAARALQGIGGGAVTAAVFAAVPELFSPAARARLVGLFTGTYGLASAIGPLLGGVLTDATGWRAVFAVNMPIGAVAALALVLAYPPRPVGAAPRIDVAGAVTLVLGASALLLALSLGGRDLPWGSPVVLGLVAIGLAALAVFARVEVRAAEPVIPLGLLGSRAVGLPTLVMALLAVGMFAATLFVPLYAQGVLGRSATRSASALLPFMLSFVGASVVVGQAIARIGRYRFAAVGGMLLAAAGLGLLVVVQPAGGEAELVRDIVLVGLGLGSALPALVIANQNGVPLSRVGVASALNTTGRAVGSTFGSAGLGAVLAAGLGSSAEGASGAALAAALQGVFLAAALVALLGAGLLLFLEEVPVRTRAPARAASPDRLPLPVPTD